MKLLLLGGGGHGRVVMGATERLVSGVIDASDPGLLIPWIGDDEAGLQEDPAATELLHGVGELGLRCHLAERYGAAGFQFARVVHPRAIVIDAQIDAGAQVMAGAIVQVGACVGAGAIVNSGAIVEHDCVIGELAHVAPGAVLAGAVTVGPRALVGVGARVLPGVSIGAGATIGGGAVVTRDVPAGATVVGVPGRVRSRS